MVFLPSISTVSIANRGVGGIGSEVGSGGVEQGGVWWDGVVWEVANLLFGILHDHPRCPHSGQ